MAADRRPRDVNQLAARIVAEATGEAEKTEPDRDDDERAADVGAGAPVDTLRGA